MNVGYIYDIIKQKLVGIIAQGKYNDTSAIAYYSEDKQLNNLIEALLLQDEVYVYSKDKNDNIILNIIQMTDKDVLHGLTYQLPYPFHICKLVYKEKSLEELYSIYMEEMNGSV